MYVTARRAAQMLQPTHSRTKAQRMLAAGLAGPPMLTETGSRTGPTLFDREAVRKLGRRELIRDCPATPEPCRDGLFVTRWDPGYVMSGAVDAKERALAAAAGPWPISFWGTLWLSSMRSAHGFAPLVVTTAGAAVVGADIVKFGRVQVPVATRFTTELIRLHLEPAGDWWSAVSDKFLNLGRGNAWTIWQGSAEKALRLPVLRPVRAAAD